MTHNKKHGFTIVELLIVIVVIGILAAITIVAYNGIQNRASDTRSQSDIKNVYTLIEKYAAETGAYPNTGGLGVVRTDFNCFGGSKQTDWIPGVTEKLPQSNPNTGRGLTGTTGCYMYASDGVQYVVSAWNMLNSGPQKSTMYRRLGFREIGFVNANAYLCNHSNIGGGASYNALNDYYKYSFTISNIATAACNETPPVGA